ncbi:MAG: hypothetical protein O9331_08835 [Acidovorax sp.]|nr:hypothetical protein [Acidovorax sp.]
MQSTIARRMLGFFVLLPSTLSAGFWTLHGIGQVVDAWSMTTDTSFVSMLAIARSSGGSALSRSGTFTTACFAEICHSTAAQLGLAWYAEALSLSH